MDDAQRDPRVVPDEVRAQLTALIDKRALPDPADVLWWDLNPGVTPAWLSIRLASPEDAEVWAARLHRTLYTDPQIDDLPDGSWRVTRRALVEPNGMVRLPGLVGEHSIGWSETRITTASEEQAA